MKRLKKGFIILIYKIKITCVNLILPFKIKLQ